MIRYFINVSYTVIIPLYIFTIDYDAKEDFLTLLQAFVTLIILVDLDNTLALTAGVNFETLKVFKHKIYKYNEENDKVAK